MKEQIMIIKIFKDLKRYGKYVKYATKSDLKSEVADSYLNWLWWILDPLLYMLVYTFVSVVVFRTQELYFPIFVFIGVTTWTFFDRTLNQSVLIVKSYKAIVSKVYIPKYMLVLEKLLVNLFKMMVTWVIVFIMILCWKVPLSPYILCIFPIVLVLVIFTFGISCILAHFGVFIDDLSNVMAAVLRLFFYLSGTFYSVEKRVPEPFASLILRFNPTSLVINELRKVLLYSTAPNWSYLITCAIIGFLLCFIGIWLIYKYENSYVKVS